MPNYNYRNIVYNIGIQTTVGDKNELIVIKKKY